MKIIALLLAIVIFSILLLLIAIPVYLIWGWKLAVTIYCLLLYINILNVIHKHE